MNIPNKAVLAVAFYLFAETSGIGKGIIDLLAEVSIVMAPRFYRKPFWNWHLWEQSRINKVPFYWPRLTTSAKTSGQKKEVNTEMGSESMVHLTSDFRAGKVVAMGPNVRLDGLGDITTIDE